MFLYNIRQCRASSDTPLPATASAIESEAAKVRARVEKARLSLARTEEKVAAAAGLEQVRPCYSA